MEIVSGSIVLVSDYCVDDNHRDMAAIDEFHQMPEKSFSGGAARFDVCRKPVVKVRMIRPEANQLGLTLRAGGVE